MTLAGLGCQVLRVDPPGGGLDFGRWPVTPGGESLFWAGLNRGKRSVVVDFRRPEGRELVAAMVVAGGAEGGVLLTNLGAGGALAHDRLRQARADVVSIEVEGYPDGRSAVDYTIAARTEIPVGHRPPRPHRPRQFAPAHLGHRHRAQCRPGHEGGPAPTGVDRARRPGPHRLVRCRRRAAVGARVRRRARAGRRAPGPGRQLPLWRLRPGFSPGRRHPGHDRRHHRQAVACAGRRPRPGRGHRRGREITTFGLRARR